MDTKKLRQKVLDLAIHGKLVKQDPNDEPASILLDRIRAEKARLVKEGKIKKSDLVEKPISEEEIPFEVPEGWEWVSVKTLLAKITDGTHNSPPNTPTGDYMYVTAKNIKDDGIDISNITYVSKAIHDEIYQRCNPEKGDILYIKDGATTGIVTINNIEEPFSLLSSVALLKPLSGFDVKYLLYYLKSPYCYNYVRSSMKGTGITRVTLVKIESWILPLPPLAEQHRIVKAVDELFEQIDVIERSEKELEEAANKTRDKLLNLAIQGHLVPQDPNEEPASVLLERIRAEKARLVKEGKLKKKDLEEKPISPDEIPFDIPEGWVWCRIGDYVQLVTDFVASGSFASLRENVTYYKEENYALLVKTKDFQSNFEKDLTFTDEKGYNFLSNSNLFGGELILSNVGSIGKVFVVPKLNRKMTLAPNAIMVRLWDDSHRDWLYYLFQSEFGIASLLGISSATAISKFNKTDFKKLLVPLPPLSEQRRIVTKLEELLQEIDKLKA